MRKSEELDYTENSKSRRITMTAKKSPDIPLGNVAVNDAL